jgi:putative SOS response-associated peptidase YedK
VEKAIRPVHERMIVLLVPEDHEQWLHGSFYDAAAFQTGSSTI